MGTLMNVESVSVEVIGDRVSVNFDCPDETSADLLCDIIADAIVAGSIRLGDLSFSSAPVTEDRNEHGGGKNASRR